MDWQGLVAIAEVVNALAVTLTLIVLVISIRQNTKAQRVLAVESLAAAIAAINITAMEDAELGSALSKTTKNWTSASREERIISHYFLFSYYKLVETAWYQKKSGALEANQWEGWERAARALYHSAGVRTGWWPSRRYAYSNEFQRYLEQTTPPTETASLYDLFNPASRRAKAK
jgi:hypothetical protein